MTEATVPESLWNTFTHVIHDPYWEVVGFLFYDPGLDGYSMTPRGSDLKPLVWGKSLEDAIATLAAFQYPVTTFKESPRYIRSDRP